jgi:PAS domain S-box-containing protein
MLEMAPMARFAASRSGANSPGIMNVSLIESIGVLANRSLPTEWEKAAWVLALFGSWIALAANAYLARSTKRDHYVLWARGWALYSFFLATSIAPDGPPISALLSALGTTAAGAAALSILWGALQITSLRRPLRERVLSVVLVALWSFIAAYLYGDAGWSTAPVFMLLGGAGVYAGLQYRHEGVNRSALNWLAGGFMLWSLLLLSFPFLSFSPIIRVSTYLGVALVTIAVGVGMVIEEHSKLSEQKYRGVLDSATAAIFVVDMWTLRVLDANKAAQRLTKRDGVDLLKSGILDLCPDLRKEGDNQLDHRSMINAVFRPYNEFHFVRADGSLVLCEGDATIVQWHQRPVLQINVRELDKEKDIGQVMRRAEKLSSLGQLIAGVAHEINNPLAVVVGYAQIMAKQSSVDDRAKKHIDKILHEAERASKIVRDLLTFARPCQPQMATADINQLVTNVLEIREAELRAAHVQLEKRLAPNLPQTKADLIQIEQVLTNLITNAMHAMAAQKGERKLTLSTEETGFFIRITVADNGPGIPSEIVGKIFDPFFTTKAPGKGTGLGLSISNTILQEHRGKIWVQSEVGKGARFFVELPVVQCEAEAAAPKPADGKPATAADNMNHRLLIVDDEPGIVEVLNEVLTAKGYRVETAASGVEAMSRVSDGRYDLIISDLCMPEMDGQKFYETVRDLDPRLANRMIFVTGDTVSPKSRKFLESTGKRWLSKPFNIGDVERMVGTLLTQTPTAARSGNRKTPA